MEKELNNAIQTLVAPKGTNFLADVVSVDRDSGICIVNSNDLDFKVRLASVINDSADKFFLYPTIGSKVLVGFIKADIHQLVVLKCSEIDEFNFKVGDSEFVIDANGMNFKKAENSLRSLTLELIAAIRAMKFTTNNGPTITLINDATFGTLKTKFETLLKDI